MNFKITLLVVFIQKYDYLLGKNRVTLVPHVGQTPCTILRPFSDTFTVPAFT